MVSKDAQFVNANLGMKTGADGQRGEELGSNDQHVNLPGTR